ncbi:Glucose 1-dehydrogenase 2 [Nocardia farcinica]|nr:Glucose 1-dehydrogenase 2 [Nocardia farcinica]
MSVPALEGKNVLIAAGAKNLGGLISRQFVEAGANVAIHYNSDPTRPAAEETLAAVEAAGRKGVLLPGDLTKVEVVERLFADAAAALGPIDIAGQHGRQGAAQADHQHHRGRVRRDVRHQRQGGVLPSCAKQVVTWPTTVR